MAVSAEFTIRLIRSEGRIIELLDEVYQLQLYGQGTLALFNVVPSWLQTLSFRNSPYLKYVQSSAEEKRAGQSKPNEVSDGSIAHRE